MDTEIRSQKLSIGALFSTGWQVYHTSFKDILPIILIVYIPIFLTLKFVSLESLVQNYGDWGVRLYFYMIKLLRFFVGSIATMGVALIVENSFRGIMLSWVDALKLALSKWISAIGTGLLAFLIILGLSLLLFIPGIIWAGYYSFWIYAVVLRNKSGKNALDYSKSLVQGQWWSVFGTLLLIGVAGGLVGSAISFSINFIFNNQLLDILSAVVVAIINTLFTVIIVVFFLNNDYRLKPTESRQLDSDNELS